MRGRYKMKKILFALILCLSLFCGCKKDEPRPMLLPTDIISLSDAQKIIGDSYTLKMKDNAVKQDENLLSVTYLSEPEGVGDGVFVELLSDKENPEIIKTAFSRSREKRSDCILVKGLGDDCYITYPSLHLYTKGMYVKITAGSKASDLQANLLIELGKIAEKNIDAYFSN